MPIQPYGLLKGTVVGHLRDADDDHYQVMVSDGKKMYRIAVNVKSSAPNAPSTVLFETTTSLPGTLTKALVAAQQGFTKLASKAGGLAQDYVRGGIVKTAKMVPVPPDGDPGGDDLKDKLEDAVTDAMDKAGTLIYAFGQRWGPETKKDQYFHFTPGNGIHDIHMNQGNDGKYKKDNGVFQDGCLMIGYPGDKWRAFFFAFQSQTFDTDDQGNRKGTAAPPSKKSATPVKSRRAAKPKKKKKHK